MIVAAPIVPNPGTKEIAAATITNAAMAPPKSASTADAMDFKIPFPNSTPNIFAKATYIATTKPSDTAMATVLPAPGRHPDAAAEAAAAKANPITVFTISSES
ncbi:hypothetical protein IMSAG025_02391 [Muribaculaceae bacterium]|nr:hypothetical protein IMSAG025_02391 [Muribaculaceae bacterium]